MTSEEIKRLVAKAKLMSSRETRYDYDIGDYWNVTENLGEALETTAKQLQLSEAVCDLACDLQDEGRPLPSKLHLALKAWRSPRLEAGKETEGGKP